jgi:hypothetical protein
MKWTSTKALLPEIEKDSTGSKSSKPVLVVTGLKQIRIATLEQYYDDEEYRWYSVCSERWDITKQGVSHWMPLPPLP